MSFVPTLFACFLGIPSLYVFSFFLMFFFVTLHIKLLSGPIQYFCPGTLHGQSSHQNCTPFTLRNASTHMHADTYIHVIFVPWVSTVHGVCTLSAVLCIPEGEARGNT